ncbi:YibE/F family protein [Anaeromicropila herbilytica]|uniref:Membrane protein n=1 Tax=Anaeromicropila herbilytica TaxID=2785025 RepID=A0A7R7IEN2_9FIRM|nr:YibE/F family protein [Anaeromicropila herbilytica]BCN31283.1 membrane protein [Anaeromicropila herbilytica]
MLTLKSNSIYQIGNDKYRNIIHKNRKKIIISSIFLILLFILYIILSHNYNYYHRTIAKVNIVTSTYTHSEENEFGDVEKYYTQKITALIMNGNHKGKLVKLNNTYSSSQVYDCKYDKGDELFITLSNNKSHTITATITGFKQDKYLLMLVSIFVLFILLISKKKGFFTIISILTNILLVSYCLDLYFKGVDILFLSICLVLCFTVFSLFLISGWNKKTIAAILSTLLSLSAMMLLYYIVLKNTSGIDYASMEYMTMPNDVEEIFLSEILIGGLGAIMDIAITMAASTSELVEKNRDVQTKDLLRSGKEIGNDIMGTMINVLLFTYLSSGIPFFILAMKNGIHIKNILTMYMPYEIYRFLTGSIGILLSIPISIFLSILLLRKGRKS